MVDLALLGRNRFLVQNTREKVAMGCTSSSLKGSDPRRSDLTTQEVAPRIIASESERYYEPPTSHASPDQVTAESMQRRQSSTKQMLEAYSHKKSAFSPNDSKPKSKGVSDEEMEKYTGMTNEELMAWGDKNIYRKGNASTAGGDGGAMMMGMQASAMVGY